jgi:hypothetical protein
MSMSGSINNNQSIIMAYQMAEKLNTGGGTISESVALALERKQRSGGVSPKMAHRGIGWLFGNIEKRRRPACSRRQPGG